MYIQNENQIKYETKLRGSTLIASTNVEFILINVVYFSNAEQWKKPSESPSLKIKKLTFGGKIKRLREMLTLHHADLLLKYDELLKELDVFLEIRNKVAHCTIYWLDSELSRLQIWDVEEPTEPGLQLYVPTEYNTDDLVASIYKSFNKITPLLVELQNEVESRLKSSYPQLHSLLTQATRTGG